LWLIARGPLRDVIPVQCAKERTLAEAGVLVKSGLSRRLAKDLGDAGSSLLRQVEHSILRSMLANADAVEERSKGHSRVNRGEKGGQHLTCVR